MTRPGIPSSPTITIDPILRGIKKSNTIAILLKTHIINGANTKDLIILFTTNTSKKIYEFKTNLKPLFYY